VIKILIHFAYDTIRSPDIPYIAEKMEPQGKRSGIFYFAYKAGQSRINTMFPEQHTGIIRQGNGRFPVVINQTVYENAADKLFIFMGAGSKSANEAEEKKCSFHFNLIYENQTAGDWAFLKKKLRWPFVKQAFEANKMEDSTEFCTEFEKYF